MPDSGLLSAGGEAGPHGAESREARPDIRNDDMREVARAAARCFGTDDGRRLLAHLRATTVERACGPQVSDAALRDLEGQRRLVHRLTALIDRGRRGD